MNRFQRQILRFVLRPAAPALLALLFVGCAGEEQPETEVRQFCLSENMKGKVKLHTVAMEPVSEGVQLTGTVEYNPDLLTHYISLVEGIVTNTYFVLGEEVKEGQLLAEIRSAELSELFAEKKSSTAMLSVAERELQSVKSMHADEIASEKELLSAQSEVDILKAEIEKIEANLSLYSASAERGLFQIKAPRSGYVVAKSLTPGMKIDPDDEPLFTISDLSEVWVVVNVYPGNVRHIKTGMPVSIRTMAYEDEHFTGEINAISQIFDREERVMKARIVMANDDYKLKPGMMVDVVVSRPNENMAPAVPSSAIIFDDNTNFIVVYRDDCDMEKRPVTLLSQSNGTTYLKEGVEENEQVVVRNHLLIFQHLKNTKSRLD